MAPDKVINERGKLQSQVRFHRAVNAGLLGTLFFGVLLLGFVTVRDTTKIALPEVKRPHEVGSDYANRGYPLGMAGYIPGMVLTVTPEAVDHNNKVVLRMIDPDGYAGLKTALDAAVIRLKQERITTIWVPRKEEVSRQDKYAKVNGKFKTSIADKPTSEREKGYLVEFTITTSGRLCVSEIEEIVRRDPSTSRPADN